MTQHDVHNVNLNLSQILRQNSPVDRRNNYLIITLNLSIFMQTTNKLKRLDLIDIN